jgi:hypothetical protein
MTQRWIDARAEGRAIALNRMGLHPHDPLAAAFGSRATELFEFLLGLRDVLAVPEPCAARLRQVIRSLGFQLAAQMGIVRGAEGIASVNFPLRAGTPGPPTAPRRRVTSAEFALLAGQAPGRRRRLGTRAPVLVLSTAGRPGDVQAALSRHLDVLGRYGHSEFSVVVADDAPDPTTAGRVESICADVQRTYGVEVSRFSEWTGQGKPGAKRRFRRNLVARMSSPEDQRTIRRILAPGLAGTANCVFARFATSDIIWLEQDAAPYALASAATGPSGRVRPHPDVFEDVVSPGPSHAERYPVDVLHVADRLLHASALEAEAVGGQRITYEDAGFESLGGRCPDPPGQAGIVHFHTCGHADFRARLGHHFVLDDHTPAARRSAFLAGGLPFERRFRGPPATVSLRRWTSAFGTVVGLRGDRLPGPPTMWATRQRLGDISVGELLQAAGVPGCIAGTALEHRREGLTDSGRGALAAYLFTEELLWPLIHAAREAFGAVGPASGYAAWLAAAASAMRQRCERSPVMPVGLACALWSELHDDVRRAERSAHAQTRAYGRALRAQAGPAWARSWTEYHRHLDGIATAELRRYAAQLHAWAQVIRVTDP